MSNIVARLSEDHRNFSKVLKVLIWQIELMKADDEPDYLLLKDCLDYFSEYSDVIHHPGEDIVFEQLIDMDESLRPIIDTLTRDHSLLKLVTRDLTEQLDVIGTNAIIGKEALRKRLEEYVTLQQGHMDMEESQVYPKLRKLITPEISTEVEQHLNSGKDPLFGVDSLARYQSLLQQITDRS